MKISINANKNPARVPDAKSVIAQVRKAYVQVPVAMLPEAKPEPVATPARLLPGRIPGCHRRGGKWVKR